MNLFDFIRIFECLISDLSSCRTCSDDPCTDLTRGVRFCHTTDVTSYVECLSPGWCFERLCAPGVAFDRLTLRCNAPMADPEKDPLEDKDDTEGDETNTSRLSINPCPGAPVYDFKQISIQQICH